MKQIHKILTIVVPVLCVLTWLGGCKKIEIVTSTTTDVNLVSYMRNNSSTYSEFLKVIDKAGSTSYLNAYGKYTLFAPSNDAFKAYLTAVGRVSVNDLTETEAKNIVRFHLIEDTLSTANFTDGKLPLPTMYGQYLITGAVNDANGVSRYIVNRQGLIMMPNVRTGNGLLHQVSQVLRPSLISLAETIAQNSEYSIFNQALVETGYADTLKTLKYVNDTIPRWLTVLAESNTVLKKAGINTYAQLKAKYSNTSNPKNDNDSLRLYMGYHILDGLKFLADIVLAPAHLTMAPQEVVLSQLSGQDILINDENFAGQHEVGAKIIRATSDVAANNGVFHDLDAAIYIKVRRPTNVYFDFGDQPEFRAQTAIFRKSGKSTAALTSFTDIKFAGTSESISYFCETPSSSNYYWWYDGITLSSLRTASNTMNWIEFKTPLVIKGRYKVWLCWRKSAGGKGVQVIVNNDTLPRVLNLLDYFPTSPDAELLANGYKRYSNQPVSNSTQAAALAGIVDINTTGRQTLRLLAVADAKGSVTLDMIQFIPVDNDQILPRCARDGSFLYQ
jgi:uncharacterized surface protein with fasciclin (FAS1) repeats